MFDKIKNEIKAKEEELERIKKRYETLKMIGFTLEPSIAKVISSKDPSISDSFKEAISRQVIEGFFKNKKEVSYENVPIYLSSLDLLILESGIDIDREIRVNKIFFEMLER